MQQNENDNTDDERKESGGRMDSRMISIKGVKESGMKIDTSEGQRGEVDKM